MALQQIHTTWKHRDWNGSLNLPTTTRETPATICQWFCQVWEDVAHRCSDPAIVIMVMDYNLIQGWGCQMAQSSKMRIVENLWYLNVENDDNHHTNQESSNRFQFRTKPKQTVPSRMCCRANFSQADPNSADALGSSAVSVLSTSGSSFAEATRDRSQPGHSGARITAGPQLYMFFKRRCRLQKITFTIYPPSIQHPYIHHHTYTSHLYQKKWAIQGGLAFLQRGIDPSPNGLNHWIPIGFSPPSSKLKLVYKPPSKKLYIYTP